MVSLADICGAEIGALTAIILPDLINQVVPSTEDEIADSMPLLELKHVVAECAGSPCFPITCQETCGAPSGYPRGDVTFCLSIIHRENGKGRG